MNIFNFEKIKPWLEFLFEGTYVTLFLAFISAFFGIALGIVLVLMSKKKVLGRISNAYIDLFRGTPLLLQLSIIYLGIPQILDRIVNDGMGHNLDFNLPTITAAVITFSLNSGAYISEIIRSGINSVDPGEIEAAKALGISKFHMYKDIILPTAFKNAFPALMNELITLVKETSIVSVIGIKDLFRRNQIVTAQTYLYFESLIVIGIIYYVLIKILSMIGRRIEVKLQHDYS